VPARIVEVRDAFPLNANGKKDLAVLRRLVEAAVAVPQAAVATPSPVPVEVHDIWRRYLGAAYAGADTNFFAASGTSLDAIALIGDYQALGYPVTAQSFLADPTPRGVSEYLGRGGTGDRRPVAAASAQRLSSEDFSAAQRWFFEQDFAQPDHWNQAILVEADSDVDADALRSAVHDVVALHPLLRTAYRHGPTGWRAEAAPAGRDVFSASRGPDPAGIADDVVAGLVRRKAQDLHAAINIGRGEVFMVHLMSLAGRPDLILLACHHLSVDAVSWRILLRDLVRAYAARLRGEAMRPPHESVTFWEWVRHNDGGRATAGQPRPRRAEDNLERDARTVWLAFTPHETAQLTRALPERTGIPLHAAVLGAFLHVLGAHRGIHQFLVDVEGHGRVTADDRVDVSRVVGWFTDVAPTSLAVVASDPMATVKGVGAVLGAAPAAASARLVVPPPPICYNFLGPFYFPPDEALRLSVSSLPIGPARGGANDRVYELKLTARTVEDQIVLDLSLHPRLDAEAALVAAMRQVHTLLLSMSGVDGAVGDPLLLVEPGSSSGLLAYVPAALRRAPARPAAIRHHPSVLLTGATGFIGIHLLRSLLTGTTSHVHCLVRGAGDAEAAERLATTYRWYFPGEALADHPGRWSVNAGDAGRADFGLPPATYRTLCTQVGAIYHCAGDTRLFGDDAAVLRTNVESVRTASRMARTGRSKELHYVSSLAVAGTNQEPEAVVFSEESLYVGQEFQNAYERSKYLGEQLVHQFTAEGGTGFIYRAGNVSGHSRSGRFQRNAGDNRLVQELRAVLRTGRLPRRVADTVVLSPVDTVAEGILAISQCGWLAGGTFHVESQHEVAYRDILDELSRLTRPFEPSDAGSIAELLARHAEQDDLTIRLGHFWASRRPRNLRFDHTRTRRLLADLGVTFGPLDREWLRRHITHLADEGHFERLQGAG
jgi:thioester reductase-like protein